MSCSRCEELLSAEDVPAGDDVYVVAFTPTQQSFWVGDRVRIREDTRHGKYLLNVKNKVTYGMRPGILIFREA